MRIFAAAILLLALTASAQSETLIAAGTPTQIAQQTRRQVCVQECQTANRNGVTMCQYLFEKTGSATYHNLDSQRTCLANVKTNFDNCMSTCPQ